MGDKMPTVGGLRYLVRIRALQSLPMGASALLEQYTDGIDRRADKQHISASTFYGSAQVGEQVTHWFVLLCGPLTRPEDLTTDLVIEHAARRYRVVRARLHPQNDRFTAVEATDLGALSL